MPACAVERRARPVVTVADPARGPQPDAPVAAPPARRRGALALVAVALLAAGTAAVLAGPGPAAPRAPALLDPSGPPASPADPASADDPWATAVSVGHVRAPSSALVAEVLRRVAATARSEARSWPLPSPDGPDVAFDRVLDPPVVRALSAAVAEVPEATWSLETVRGTTVALSVTATPGAPCWLDDEGGRVRVALDEAQSAQLSEVLPMNDMTAYGERFTVSYTGPAVASDALRRAEGVLREACRPRDGGVAYDRPTSGS